MSARNLHVSDQLALPRDAVTSTLIVYGGKGMGKTNFGSVLAEELTKAGLRWCALDPMGVWYGVRHAADGKGDGLECVILGGPHADLPILPTGGAVVADFVVDEEVNVVIDFSRKPSGELWSIGEKVRFVTDYALRLFARQGELRGGGRRPPLFQILDEAARYVPQVIPHGSPDLARSVGAWEQLVEEGRNVSLGVGLLTQRSARINKSVAELADAMIAFRTVGPNSIEAVVDWLGAHVEKKVINEFVEQVRQLDVGQALVVSPGWLKFEGVVQMRARETFDSSRTLGAGDTGPRIRGKGATPPDLAKYRERMADTIEKATADDPKTLRRRIAELEKQTAARIRGAAVETRTIEKKILTAKDRAAIDRLAKVGEGLGGKTMVWFASYEQITRQLLSALSAASSMRVDGAAVRAGGGGPVSSVGQAEGQHRSSRPTLHMKESSSRDNGSGGRTGLRDADTAPARTTDEGITRSQHRILDALEWLSSLGYVPASKVQVAVLAHQSPSGGGYANNLGKLRTFGLIDYPQPGTVALTSAGAGRGDASAIASGGTVLEQACRLVPASQAAILRALAEAHPEDLSKVELAERVGQSAEGGGFANNLGKLRSLGFIDYPAPGRAVALDVLFIGRAA